ncbi:GntR family transcriptional regulator [Loigolactobacillus rennini]|uniref:Transcriptional regulator n=1 Tax=Loigolactobacillus rennini DSM 20253 TaxID=1423796 RepID=A0A0R2D458_9LACO|nr:GntR family transcriptional regulator [Loigolactobacillus rennini]KRM98749.1 transcriptional regulator [Loigolactobacillus rennini DSM 20253]
MSLRTKSSEKVAKTFVNALAKNKNKDILLHEYLSTQDEIKELKTIFDQPMSKRTQISSDIQKDITNKRKVGDKLPSETEYAKHYNVARSTIQKVLKDLERLHLITRIQGKGSFVTLNYPKIDMFNFKGFSDYAREIGATPITKLIEKKIIRKKLILKRLRSININGKITPLTFDTSIIDLQTFSGLSKYNFEKNSLYETMRKQYDVQPSNAILNVIPILGTDQEHTLLKVDKDTPLLKISGKVFDNNENLVENLNIVYSNQANFKFIIGI